MRLTALLLGGIFAAPLCAGAQDTTTVKGDSSKIARDSTRAAPPVAKTPQLDVSGVVFGNYQYHTDAASRDQNRFDLERAYLTLRAPAGDRVSVRVTTDVFQQTTSGADSYYKGWVVRAKYAYLQYEFKKAAAASDWSALGRIGLVQTVFIDQEENFWPRWLAMTPLDRAGFFSSADAGAAALVTFPRKLGEAYGAVTNGPGYTSHETDRFKDVQARVTLTPLGGSTMTYLRALAIDGWVYRGAIASKFANGGAGQIGPVWSGLDRNRWGLFAGFRDPRLTIGADYAERQDGGESGANTITSPRSAFDSTGRLTAAYIVAKPFWIVRGTGAPPLGVVLRYDRVVPNTSTPSATYHALIGGVTWDLSSNAAISIDYQEQLPTGAPIITPQKIWYAHWVANF